MNEDITQDVHLIMQQVYSESAGGTSQEPDEEEEVIQVHHYPNALVIIHEKHKSTSTTIPIVDSIPKDTQESQAPQLIPYLTVAIFLLLVLSSLIFQLYLLFNPFVATVSIIPLSKTITTTTTITAVSGTPQPGEIQGHLLPTITREDRRTVEATGRGHQNASVALGAITFYNGLLTSQTIAAGTIFTDPTGVQIITDQTTIIPAAVPPIEGIATVPAHAVLTGATGNIPAKDIDTACCAPSVLAVNLAPFQGGADARDYTYLTHTDIDTPTNALKQIISDQMQQQLEQQVMPGEALVTPTCSETINADHQPGDEVTTATVTVREQCIAVTYQNTALEDQATKALTHIATKNLDPRYMLIGTIQVNVLHATIQDAKRGIASIALTISGTWVYQFSKHELDHIKALIAGKTKEQALHIISHIPGIQSANSDLPDDRNMPKRASDIHVLIVVVA